MRITRRALAALLMFAGAQAVLAHVTISPRESQTGTEQRYTMRVPTERDTPTVRIEAEFPREVSVAEIDRKQGWDIESKRNAEGRIVAVVWSGGSIARGEAEAFSFLARNPLEEGTLVWKVIQIHADGSRAEWTAEPGSRNPAPVTTIRDAARQ